MADLGVLTVAALMILGLVGGIGITALGPGGVLPTIGLFTLTGLSAPVVAGTAIVTHVATGLAGSAAFAKSGQLRAPDTRRTAIVLAATGVLGTPLGVLVNSSVSERVFGIMLAVLVTAAAVLIWVRDRQADAGESGRHPRAAAIVGLGLAVSIVSGIIGIGGPMLAVPALIACGVPVLESLAASQVQSIVIALVGSVGYATQGSIDWQLAALIGIPELAGVIIGWRIAHALPTHVLKNMLIVALLALAPYLALA
ncbi:sulfite exporter TauE/SafE family protein [Gordonia sp. HY285]|uniref:Probable membrane transporter protein n=1 Tax=Gordonia liuliyuniae TaxID=2911517 RepID=A0ABS9IV99_9ACTN|nr:sulfite exporter TauE/SafE family protein [Gordonia liuliyuniae]MCF8589489.1 sulfite exporter TauE/SafE family protein [Gordonia liuliyuniae]MCF8611445.1 sulfite exporter TauE/SafE family protein [Gordonia liuliyuniae]